MLKNLQETSDTLLHVADWYERAFKQFGPNAKGVCWRDEEGQLRRFEVLCKIFQESDDPGVSVNDFGCGYGKFFAYLEDRKGPFITAFYGTDLVEASIEAAKRDYPSPRAHFSISMISQQVCDYSFASGPFNLCGETPHSKWQELVFDQLILLWAASKKGMAFNMLSHSHSNAKRDHRLFFAKASEFVDFCQSALANAQVTLLEDYGMDEFTILVRRGS